jgi:hypothetical protein
VRLSDWQKGAPVGCNMAEELVIRPVINKEISIIGRIQGDILLDITIEYKLVLFKYRKCYTLSVSTS